MIANVCGDAARRPLAMNGLLVVISLLGGWRRSVNRPRACTL